MRTIIAGSRTVTDYALVEQAVSESGFEITEVVCGCAEGADRLGFDWARKNNVPVNFHPAWPHQFQWALENSRNSEPVQCHFGASGPYAGFRRNGMMAVYGEALIAVRCAGKSNGTDDMIKRATNRGLKVFVKRV